MTEMKFKFTIQDYQTAAVDSVVTVFAGQPFQNKMSYRRDTGSTISDKNLFNWEVSDEDLYIGFSNAPVELDSHQLLNNIRDVQNDNNIKESSSGKAFRRLFFGCRNGNRDRENLCLYQDDV